MNTQTPPKPQNDGQEAQFATNYPSGLPRSEPERVEDGDIVAFYLCAWCSRFFSRDAAGQSFYVPARDGIVSHGICRPCLAVERAKFQANQPLTIKKL